MGFMPLRFLYLIDGFVLYFGPDYDSTFLEFWEVLEITSLLTEFLEQNFLFRSMTPKNYCRTMSVFSNKTTAPEEQEI